MKIFISYKQSGVDDIELTDKLGKIREYLKNRGHKCFIYYFDSDFSDKTYKQIIEISKEQISDCDLFLAFINHENKSEGMLLELGIAYGLDKPVIILINTKYQDDYYLTYGVSNNTILFDDFNEIPDIINKFLTTDDE